MTRYYLDEPYSSAHRGEREVSKAEYVRAEREAGFYNTLGQPDEPATASFSSTKTGVSGRIEDEPWSR